MLVCASIIAQPIESQENKKSFSINMLGNYAGFAQSVVAIVDFFARQALAGSRHAGLVSAWSHREGPPGCLVCRKSFAPKGRRQSREPFAARKATLNGFWLCTEPPTRKRPALQCPPFPLRAIAVFAPNVCSFASHRATVGDKMHYSSRRGPANLKFPVGMQWITCTMNSTPARATSSR